MAERSEAKSAKRREASNQKTYISIFDSKLRSAIFIKNGVTNLLVALPAGVKEFGTFVRNIWSEKDLFWSTFIIFQSESAKNLGESRRGKDQQAASRTISLPRCRPSQLRCDHARRFQPRELESSRWLSNPEGTFHILPSRLYNFQLAPMIKCTRKGPAGSQKLKPNARRWRGNKIIHWYNNNCLNQPWIYIFQIKIQKDKISIAFL